MAVKYFIQTNIRLTLHKLLYTILYTVHTILKHVITPMFIIMIVDIILLPALVRIYSLIMIDLCPSYHTIICAVVS